MPEQNKYFNYIRSQWALPVVHSWLTGPIKYTHTLFPWRWSLVLTTKYNDQSGWHYYRANLENIGQKMVKYFKNHQNLLHFQKLFSSSGKTTIRLANIALKTNWTKTSNEKLGQAFSLLNTAFEKFSAIAICLDGTDEILQQIFEKKLKAGHIPLKAADISILLTPDEPSYIEKETRDLCRLIGKYKPSGLSQKNLLIKQHVKKWWWKDLGWGQFEPLNEKTLRQMLTKAKETEQLKQKFLKDTRETKNRIMRKKELCKALPLELKNFLRMFEVLAILHDKRKEVQMKMMSALLKIGRIIVNNHSLPSGAIFLLTPDEVIGLTQGIKPANKIFTDRQNYYWCYSIKQETKIISGAKALKVINQSGIYAQPTKSTIVQGVIASGGKVVGPARVGMNPKDLIKNIKPGEILITGMTSPDYVPAMKKASAVVTDEGGITCHAAIVSRELGIPCIINTKIATRLFKTGDLIEVNANHGWIRKL